MKNLIIIVALTLFTAELARAQTVCADYKTKDSADTPCHRYGLWYTPVGRSTIIDGIAIGIWAAPEKHSLVINGINFEANPVAIPLFAYMLIGGIAGPFSNDSTEQFAVFGRYQFPDGRTPITDAKIRGLNVSSSQLGGETDGVGINLVSSMAGKVNGLEVSGLMNLHYSFKGVVVAGLRNKVTHGRGVQIALFNDCRDGTVLQIGLLNTIGKRRTPFVNFSLRSKKKSRKID